MAELDAAHLPRQGRLNLGRPFSQSGEPQKIRRAHSVIDPGASLDRALSTSVRISHILQANVNPWIGPIMGRDRLDR